MKTKFLTLTACALLGTGMTTFAQTAEPPPPPPPKSPGKQEGAARRMMKERMAENLPPELRERFKAAREKALQDPKIQELRKSADTANGEFFKAMRDKMQEIDPGLGELLKKEVRKDGKGGKNKREKDPGGPDGGSALTAEEKDKLMSAREKAKEDPAVQAAQKQKDAAQTPEDRKAASGEYRKAMHNAMTKADPSAGPLLEKMHPQPPPMPPAPGGDGEMAE